MKARISVFGVAQALLRFLVWTVLGVVPAEAALAQPSIYQLVPPAQLLLGGTMPLKVAFVYVGGIGDGGWTYQHELGRLAVEAEFGDKVQVTYVENVPEGDAAEAVFSKLTAAGNKLIFATTFGYMEPLARVARSNILTRFEHATGYRSSYNLRTYDARTYEGAYMAGIVAGRMTKSGVLGFVGSVPIPETIRNINSFTLGARSVNPTIMTRVAWVNSWFNPPAEAHAAQALIDAGADVLMQNTDSAGVLQTAERNGKRAFGWDSDMQAYGPAAHLGSSTINWAPYYIKATRDVMDGTWITGNYWWGVRRGAIDLVSIAPDVPQGARAEVELVKKRLAEASFSIWTGPIRSNDGRLQIAAGGIADDEFLQKMNFFVEGIEGGIPGAER